MGKTNKFFGLCFFVVIGSLSLPANLGAEFYKYVDKEGRIFYVDELYKIPEEYRQKVNVYREKYDHLSGEERSRALKKEHEQIQEQELEQQRQVHDRLQEIQRLEDEETRKKTEEARQKLLEKMQTPIIIEDNHILVPVTLGNNGVEVDTNLLLDTGASQIVLFRSFAQQLNIMTLTKGRAQVAGGQTIHVETGRISYFRVGPHNMQNAMVLIIAQEGDPLNYSGLLGMNFLKNMQYTIDYPNQVIRWEQPANNKQGLAISK